MKAYPRPKETGGRLIREVIRFFRARGIELPISSHILIAVSGGPDSIALAHLLIKYGRRVVPPSNISLIHINHGWRPKRSDGDQRFVDRFAKSMGVRLFARRVESPPKGARLSWEAFAREQRKRIFEELAQAEDALVLTAHQADDLAETVLWRILTGQADTHGGGIVVRDGCELRPLLGIRKKELLHYLKEEAQRWRLDETNLEGRFLRSRMRLEVLPALESVFPRSVEHLARLGLDAQAKSAHLESRTPGFNDPAFAPELLLGVARVHGRRSHWKALYSNLEKTPRWEGAIDLPGGWRLTREYPGAYQQNDMTCATHETHRERWVLEKS